VTKAKREVLEGLLGFTLSKDPVRQSPSSIVVETQNEITRQLKQLEDK